MPLNQAWSLLPHRVGMPHWFGSGLSGKGSSGTSGLRSSATRVEKAGASGGKVGVGEWVAAETGLEDSEGWFGSAVPSNDGLQAVKIMSVIPNKDQKNLFLAIITNKPLLLYGVGRQVDPLKRMRLLLLLRIFEVFQVKLPVYLSS